MNTIILKTYSAPDINVKEILRYANANNDPSTLALLEECINEAQKTIVYKICYMTLPVKTSDNICDFNTFLIKSKNLATNLKDCSKTIIMGATIGIGIDRLISKYSHISPAKALLLQAFGTERIEALCDTFCTDMQNTHKFALKPRFSAGYGDLPLEAQKQFFTHLKLSKNIGLTLNNSMLMSPTKSVTAFIGIQEV